MSDRFQVIVVRAVIFTETDISALSVFRFSEYDQSCDTRSTATIVFAMGLSVMIATKATMFQEAPPHRYVMAAPSHGAGDAHRIHSRGSQ